MILLMFYDFVLHYTLQNLQEKLHMHNMLYTWLVGLLGFNGIFNTN